MTDWTQRRDEGGRMTLPPLPTKGGNPNAPAPDGVVQGAVSAVARAQQQEPQTRAIQQARRLQVRGQPTSEDVDPLVDVQVPLPADPAIEPYHAAGWV